MEAGAWATDDDLIRGVELITSYVDSIVSTVNPAVAADGSNAETAPKPKTNPHMYNKPYSEVEDMKIDLIDLIATCQRHTRCSSAYCLRKKGGREECRFGFPKTMHPATSIVTENDEPQLLTARNDCLLNSYNPVQLSAWRDMQFVVSCQRVLKYIAKYATKSEPRSKALKSLYRNVMKTCKDDGTPLKVAQKLLNSVGDRDYSAQETCHLLLQLPLYRCSRDFVILSLDGSREVSDQLEEGESVTVDSLLDHYCSHPTTPHYEDMTLLQFVRRYKTPKKVGGNLVYRKKEVVVIVRPFCSPDPKGPKYEQYCKQKLMTHVPFRQVDELLLGDSYTKVYSQFLKSGAVSASLADDIQLMEDAERNNRGEVTNGVSTGRL